VEKDIVTVRVIEFNAHKYLAVAMCPCSGCRSHAEYGWFRQYLRFQWLEKVGFVLGRRMGL
jgi:hypothetical protein